jgi:hypothetical protein
MCHSSAHFAIAIAVVHNSCTSPFAAHKHQFHLQTIQTTHNNQINTPVAVVVIFEAAAP